MLPDVPSPEGMSIEARRFPRSPGPISLPTSAATPSGPFAMTAGRWANSRTGPRSWLPEAEWPCDRSPDSARTARARSTSWTGAAPPPTANCTRSSRRPAISQIRCLAPIVPVASICADRLQTRDLFLVVRTQVVAPGKGDGGHPGLRWPCCPPAQLGRSIRRRHGTSLERRRFRGPGCFRRRLFRSRRSGRADDDEGDRRRAVSTVAQVHPTQRERPRLGNVIRTTGEAQRMGIGRPGWGAIDGGAGSQTNWFSPADGAFAYSPSGLSAVIITAFTP